LREPDINKEINNSLLKGSIMKILHQIDQTLTYDKINTKVKF